MEGNTLWDEGPVLENFYMLSVRGTSFRYLSAVTLINALCERGVTDINIGIIISLCFLKRISKQ
jgi:hypothetical protein